MISSTVMKIAAMREHMGTSLKWSCRQYINIWRQRMSVMKNSKINDFREKECIFGYQG